MRVSFGSRGVGHLLLVAVLASGIALVLAPQASAAAPGLHDAPLPLSNIAGDIWGAISGVGKAAIGVVNWTVGLASKFILNTIGGLVKLLIPKSWINESLNVMHWIVAVPNFGTQVTTPGGGRAYGFAGVNDIRSTMQ